jgi:hypothetical protein
MNLATGLLRLWHLAASRSNHSARSHPYKYLAKGVKATHYYPLPKPQAKAAIEDGETEGQADADGTRG